MDGEHLHFAVWDAILDDDASLPLSLMRNRTASLFYGICEEKPGQRNRLRYSP